MIDDEVGRHGEDAEFEFVMPLPNDTSVTYRVQAQYNR